MIIILDIEKDDFPFSPNSYSDNWKIYSRYLRTNIRRPIVKIELLRREDEAVCASITGDILSDGGNITITKQNGCRRSVEFTLINMRHKYVPKYEGRIWIREKVRVYLGFIINDINYWIPQGIFVLDNPIAVSECSKQTVSIRALDKFSLLDGTLGGELSSNLIFPAGSSVFAILKTILAIAKDPKPFLFDLDYNTVTTYAIEKACGDKLGDIILELANMLACNVYYDNYGMLRFERDTVDESKPSLQDFGTNEVNYLGTSEEFKFSDFYNSVLVIGDNSNGNVCSYKAINNNITSDLSVNTLGFERCKVITDTNISTIEQAMARASFELKKLIALQSSIKLSCIPMYHLDVDEVITLTDENLELNNERFLIEGIQIPLAIGGKMTIDAVKVVTLKDF